MCKSRRTCFMFYCMFYVTCDRSFNERVVLCQAILIFNVVEFTPLSYGDRVLPDWSQAVGWLIAVSSVAVIPIFAIYQFYSLSRQPQYSQLSFLPVIYATADSGCVHVLQMFFFSFFSVHKNMRQPFSGTAERIFMKLLPNDRGM